MRGGVLLIYAFKRSKIASLVVMVVSVAIAIIIWFRDRDQHIIVPIIASILMLAIGYFSARVLGNVLASMENTRYLGYLHMELDPEKFISCYREAPDRMKGSDVAICRSYLADAYAAAGDYDMAIGTLSPGAPEGNLPVQGLYASNLSGYYLCKGDVPAATQQIQRLEEIIDACRLNKADLARNLTTSLKLHQQHLNCLNGCVVDTEWLEDAFQSAQYNIRRLEIARVLAMTALRDGNQAAAKKQLSYLRKNGGKTEFKRWAERQN